MKYLIFAFALCLLSGAAFPQSKKKEEKQAALAKAVTDRKYLFDAQTMIPAAGRTRQLTSVYTLRLSKDTLDSDLPYFGRAYTAPIGETKSPLQFRSTNFSYDVRTSRKGNWEVSIKFRDNKDVQVMNLNVSKDGFATLLVTPTNRSSISFNGSVSGK